MPWTDQYLKCNCLIGLISNALKKYFNYADAFTSLHGILRLLQWLWKLLIRFKIWFLMANIANVLEHCGGVVLIFLKLVLLKQCVLCIFAASDL